MVNATAKFEEHNNNTNKYIKYNDHNNNDDSLITLQLLKMN